MEVAKLSGDKVRLVDLPTGSAGIATKGKVASQYD